MRCAALRAAIYLPIYAGLLGSIAPSHCLELRGSGFVAGAFQGNGGLSGSVGNSGGRLDSGAKDSGTFVSIGNGKNFVAIGGPTNDASIGSSNGFNDKHSDKTLRKYSKLMSKNDSAPRASRIKSNTTLTVARASRIKSNTTLTVARASGIKPNTTLAVPAPQINTTIAAPSGQTNPALSVPGAQINASDFVCSRRNGCPPRPVTLHRQLPNSVTSIDIRTGGIDINQ